MPRLILLAHGSPDPRHRDGVERIMAGVGAELAAGGVSEAGGSEGGLTEAGGSEREIAETAAVGAWSVSVAYLQHHGPDLAESLADLPTGAAGPRAAGASPTIIQPLLLTGGEHERDDVPAVVPGVKRPHGTGRPDVSELTTLPGIRPLELVPAIWESIAGARSRRGAAEPVTGAEPVADDRPATDVALVAAGSQVADLREHFGQLLAELSATPAATDPSADRGTAGPPGWLFHLIDRPAGLIGHPGIHPGSLVIPLVIAPGRILDRISTGAGSAGAAVGPAVGQTPGFARLLVDRAVSAL